MCELKKENSLKTILLAEITSLGLEIEGCRRISDNTAFEITVNVKEGIAQDLKKLTDYGDLSYEGFSQNKEGTKCRIIYCQKSPERLMRDRLYNHLVNLGFLIKDSGETSPNAGFIFSVKSEEPELLKKLDTFENLLFSGYASKSKGCEYDLVYVFPKVS